MAHDTYSLAHADLVISSSSLFGVTASASAVLARSQPMRHASQLSRGLAEAARSIEKPHIPRHVPLPSSSYSGVAQASVKLSPPNSAAYEKDFSRAAALQNNGQTHKTSVAAESSHKPFSQRGPEAKAGFQGSHGPQAALQSKRQDDDSSQLTDSVQPIDSHSSLISTQRKQGLSLANGQRKPGDVRVQIRPPVKHQPDLGSKSSVTVQTKLKFSDSTKAFKNAICSRHTDASRGLQKVTAAYPHLSEPQANLLLQTLDQMESLRSYTPSAALAWYEDFVWTAERQSQGLERIETPESLSLLLRYAYSRNDLRSLLRIESRAARMTSIIRRSCVNVFTTDPTPKAIGGSEIDDVSIWPSCNEDPIVLAYNLKIAFAAREGNWVKVEELLNGTNLASAAYLQAPQSRNGSGPAKRSGSLLNAIGWGSLLRFGLCNVKSIKPGRLSALHEPMGSSTNPPLLHNIEDEHAHKGIQDEAYMQAKLSVIKRLLPDLVRFSSKSINNSKFDKVTSADASHVTTASAGGEKTPAWLLRSVLTQLAESGEVASTLRIVQLAVSEELTAIQPTSTGGRGVTHILNLVLMGCARNQSVNLAESLRIFNSLTGSQLGESIFGAVVVAPPFSISEDRSAQQSERKQLAGEKAAKDETRGRVQARHAFMAPNEESLVLVLKKVRHPLFRASWTHKLVAEFERLFAKVKLSGRTYRMIIDKCVTPAPACSLPGESDAVASTATVEPSAATPRFIASGRRGRRLRQKAMSDVSSSARTNPTAAPLHAEPRRTTRGAIVKQSILSQTLDHILHRFNPDSRSSLSFHLSTTNRRRFEHTLLRAKRSLLSKKDKHLQRLRLGSATARLPAGTTSHHSHAVSQIDALLHRIAQVQRLGRQQEAHAKKMPHTAAHSDTATHPRQTLV